MSDTLIRPPEPSAEPPADGPYTVEEFYRLVPDGVKADLIDGWIYVASPDTAENNQLTNFVLFLLQGYAEARDAGEVFASRFAFRLAPRRAPEPDVAFVARERLSIVERGGATAAPDIAVEVVAQESRERDYRDKYRLYGQAGVREYWLLDPLKKEAHFYQLRQGKYVAASLSGGVYRSEALPGFWLRADWLFARPLPGALACLQEILAAE